MTGDRRFCFEAYGVTCGVAVRHTCRDDACQFPDLADGVVGRQPPGAIERPESTPTSGEVSATCRGQDVVVADGDGVEEVYRDAAYALHAVDGAIRSIIAVQAPGLVFIHAGCVAFGSHAVVLPGRSMAGKTTFVAALVEAGATYLSDEYAVIDETGRVRPYPRKLSIRDGQSRREVPVGDLGGTAAAGPLDVALVASIVYETGAGWRIADGGQTECVDALISNAVAARARSSEVLARTAALARSVRFVSGVRGEAAAGAAELKALASDIVAVRESSTP